LYSVITAFEDELLHMFFITTSLIIFNRQVPTEDGEKKASENGALFLETSAKAGYNVKQLFKKIGNSLPWLSGDEEKTKQNAGNAGSKDILFTMSSCRFQSTESSS
jgi:hypothetical protein